MRAVTPLSSLSALGRYGTFAALCFACGASGPAHSPPAATDPSGEWEVRWKRASGWQPPFFNGRLSIQRDGEKKWAASLHFRESSVTPRFWSLRMEGNRIDIVFHVPDAKADEAEMELAGTLAEDRLDGQMRWGGDIPWTPCGGYRVGDAPD